MALNILNCTNGLNNGYIINKLYLLICTVEMTIHPRPWNMWNCWLIQGQPVSDSWSYPWASTKACRSAYRLRDLWREGVSGTGHCTNTGVFVPLAWYDLHPRCHEHGSHLQQAFYCWVPLHGRVKISERALFSYWKPLLLNRWLSYQRQIWLWGRK